MHKAKWIAEKVWDLASSNFTSLLVWIGGSGLMFYLGSITDWAKSLGPLGWALLAISAMLIAALGYWLTSRASQSRSLQKYVEGKAQTRGVNVLARIHEHERLNLHDFYSPYFFQTENVAFTDCELYGPAMVAISGNTFSHVRFVDCEIVIVRSDRPLKGALMLKNCSFLRGRIVRATFVMNHSNYLSLPQDMRDHTPVISDGRIGDA